MTIDCEVIDLRPQKAAVVKAQVRVDELPDFFGEAFEATMSTIEQQGLEATGPPFAYYPATPTTVIHLEAGFPASDDVDPDGTVDAFELPGGTAVMTTHFGPYDTMEETYALMRSWMADHGYEPSPGLWEVYLTGPDDEPDPARWRTRIVWPVKAGPAGRRPNRDDPAPTRR